MNGTVHHFSSPQEHLFGCMFILEEDTVERMTASRHIDSIERLYEPLFPINHYILAYEFSRRCVITFFFVGRCSVRCHVWKGCSVKQSLNQCRSMHAWCYTKEPAKQALLHYFDYSPAKPVSDTPHSETKFGKRFLIQSFVATSREIKLVFWVSQGFFPTKLAQHSSSQLYKLGIFYLLLDMSQLRNALIKLFLPKCQFPKAATKPTLCCPAWRLKECKFL